MKSIQEIFTGEFQDADSALIQKIDSIDFNIKGMKLGYTESWPKLNESFDLIVLVIKKIDTPIREIWAGKITEILPSISVPRKVRIYANRFDKVGELNSAEVSDADFYGTKGGGGSRVKVRKTNRINSRDISPLLGSMERRLVWVRKNHQHFRDPVYAHWEGKCAVHNSGCNGLLVASHIFPWSRSSPEEKTDFNNGVLLSAPLDKLFDRGLISFTDDGHMIVSQNLTKTTKAVFGISSKRMSIANKDKITKKMKTYFKRHRKFFGIE